MYQIMKTGSTAYLGCQDGRGEYPTGGTMGKAFCLFDTLGLVRITYFYLNKDWPAKKVTIFNSIDL